MRVKINSPVNAGEIAQKVMSVPMSLDVGERVLERIVKVLKG